MKLQISSRVLLFLISFGFVVPSTYCQFSEKKDKSTQLIFDTLSITILPHTALQEYYYPFANNITTYTLSQNEFDSIQSIIIKTVEYYNKSLKRDSTQLAIDLVSKHYKKQIISFINEKGKKEAYIVCFLKNFGNDWKKEIVEAKDVGNWLFQLKIDLASFKCYDFHVSSSM